MEKDTFEIKKITESNKSWIKKVALEEWGGEFCVFLGRKFYLEDFEGFYLENISHEKLGLITYEIRSQICEIMTLNAFKKFQSIGTKLLNKLKAEATKKGCNKILVRTTNDNLDALRFYQKRGYVITKLYPNALEADRKMKPQIPEFGDYGLPMRDVLELELTI